MNATQEAKRRALQATADRVLDWAISREAESEPLLIRADIVRISSELLKLLGPVKRVTFQPSVKQPGDIVL